MTYFVLIGYKTSVTVRLPCCVHVYDVSVLDVVAV